MEKKIDKKNKSCLLPNGKINLLKIEKSTGIIKIPIEYKRIAGMKSFLFKNKKIKIIIRIESNIKVKLKLTTPPKVINSILNKFKSNPMLNGLLFSKLIISLESKIPKSINKKIKNEIIVIPKIEWVKPRCLEK
nr:hypothetical protein [Methanobrevibacter curvatus]